MFRYLKAAFWSRPQIPLLRYFPWNAFLVAGAAMAGFIDPFVWVAALGFETVFLSTLATNPQFQSWVDARTGHLISEPRLDREELLRNLGGAARQRFIRLEEKVARIEKLSQENRADDILFESNRTALRKLSLLYLKLLAGQRNMMLLKSADAVQLKEQIEQLEKELRDPQTPDSVREAKRATLDLATQRLRNIERRDDTLKEIESDLARIEAQIDLAVEEASLKEHPIAISANIGLVSQLLDDSAGFGVRDSGFTLDSQSRITNPESPKAEH